MLFHIHKLAPPTIIPRSLAAKILQKALQSLTSWLFCPSPRNSALLFAPSAISRIETQSTSL